MFKEIVPASKELQDADVALRRAALSAKKQAEQLGTPYVVYYAENDKVMKNTIEKTNK